MSERVCQRPGCGNPIRSSRRRDVRWCSRSCEGKARRAARRKADFEDKYGIPDELLPVEAQGLAELHDRASVPQHWADIEAGHVDDDPIEFSDQYDVAVYEHEHLDDEQNARYHAMFREDGGQRAPRETWTRWRSYGRRHGVEDPAQTQDRIQRHMAAERAADARRDANTTGRVQSRHDPRTTGSVALRGTESRGLNLRHVEQPPLPPRGFDFRTAPAIGHQGRASGHDRRYGGSAWQMRDGFIA